MEGKEIGAFTLICVLGRIKSIKESEYQLDDCTGIIEIKDIQSDSTKEKLEFK
jgi:hypothetical protein